MIYLKAGRLPWHRLTGARTRHERYNLIVQKKFETKPEELVTEDMPAEFFMFYQYVRELDFDTKPDYGYLHRLLRDLIYSESYNRLIAFEWLVENQVLPTTYSSAQKKLRKKLEKSYSNTDHEVGGNPTEGQSAKQRGKSSDSGPH